MGSSAAMGETLSPSPNGARTFDKDEKPGWPTLDIPTTFPRTLEFLEGDWNHRIIESAPWAALAWLQEPAHRRPDVASAFAPGDRAYRPRFPLVLDAHLRVVTANRGFLSDVQDELIRTFRLVRFWTGRANVSDNRTLDAPSLRSSIVNVGPGPHV
jgi:hypothetical protein